MYCFIARIQEELIYLFNYQMLSYLHTHKKKKPGAYIAPVELLQQPSAEVVPPKSSLLSEPILDVLLSGGLGNRLFQLAAGLSFSRVCGRKFILSKAAMAENVHSTEDYFKTVLSFFSCYIQALPAIDYTDTKKIPPGTVCVNELVYQTFNYKNIPSPADYTRTHLIGYFQNYNFIPNDFQSCLRFDTSIAEKYPKLPVSAFIHVRGGDYRTTPLHNVNLTRYYSRAIDYVRKRSNPEHFYIFTNDIEFCKSQSFLQNVPYTIVEEKEVDSLYLMSQCKRGAICPNSSFSWWGAYLDRERPITFPSVWFTDKSYATGGLYFPKSTVIPI